MMLNKNKILLRAIEESDLEIMYNFRFSNDSYYYFYESPITSFENYKKWIQLDQNKSDRINFAIEEKSSKKTIGMISLINIDKRSRKAEMGRVFLNSDNRGNGYFKDTVESLLLYAFGDLNLRKIYCEVFSDNKRAINAYLKNGFSKEATLTRHVYKNYSYKDIEILSIFREND